MKYFQRNLLIVLAIGLCGLCLYQWHDQIVQRNAIGGLNQLVFQRDTAIQGYTNSLATLNHQVGTFDAELTTLKEAAQANEALITTQKRELNRISFLNQSLTNQVAEYQTGVDALEAKLKEAATGITKQNAALAELATQRDELVTKYNAAIKDRNDIVAKYNDLVKQIQKAQADAAGKN